MKHSIHVQQTCAYPQALRCKRPRYPQYVCMLYVCMYVMWCDVMLCYVMLCYVMYKMCVLYVMYVCYVMYLMYCIVLYCIDVCM